MGNSEPSKKSKLYKTAAMLFAISGFIFIAVTVSSGEVGLFLPVGIALVILGVSFWRLSRKLTDS